MPGWGHYYVNQDQWNRGKVHLASDVILIISYFGLDIRASSLQSQSITLANLRAGIDLDGRSRSLRLAVGEFHNIQEYNNHQLRTRNWNNLIEDTPDNRWQWQSTSDRQKYHDLRQRSDNTRQYIPAVISLLVVNRVISGISAFSRAKDIANLPVTRIEPAGIVPGDGLKATITIRF